MIMNRTKGLCWKTSRIMLPSFTLRAGAVYFSSQKPKHIISSMPSVPPIRKIMIYRRSRGSVSSSRAAISPNTRLKKATIISRTESQRPRIRAGARSENQGNQQTLITALQQEEIPSRKISDHSGSQAGLAGTITGISPKISHSIRENNPMVIIYFFR